MSATTDRLRRARGPLTGIALLFLGAAVALFLTTSSGDPSSGPVTAVSIPDELVATSSTAPEDVPEETTPEDTIPEDTIPEETLPESTVAPSTSAQPPTTVRPTTTVASTTTAAPRPVVWRNVIPALPGGGSATLIEGTDYRYAVNISYPSYQPQSLATAMESSFKGSGWTTSVSGTTVSVQKANVAGTIVVSASGSGSKAVLDLRSIG